MEFQRVFELPQSGIIDNDTWNSIYSAYKTTLKKYASPAKTSIFPSPHFKICDGDENGIIYVIQAMLTALGAKFSNIPELEINGKFDQNTQNAVTEIQNTAGIRQTGEIDKETWEIISVLFETFISHNYINPLQKNGKYIIRTP